MMELMHPMIIITQQILTGLEKGKTAAFPTIQKLKCLRAESVRDDDSTATTTI